MKIIGRITILLSLLLMMGHDMVPHLDDTSSHHVHLEVDNGNLPISHEADQELGHLFSHLQHGTSDRSIVYTYSVEKAVSFHNAVFILAALNLFDFSLHETDDGPRTRQWDSTPLSSNFYVSAFSLRGPPSLV